VPVAPRHEVLIGRAPSRRIAHVVPTDTDEDHFVAELIANLTAYPTYYAHIGPANTAGPANADLAVPEPLTSDQLVRRLRDGGWVVDLRHRVAFADNHLEGSVSFEYGDGASFTTFLGWVLPWGDPITLAGGRADVENAIRDLSRIGIDSPDVALGDDPADLAPAAATTSYPRVDWSHLLDHRPADETVLDVRRADEYATCHVEGAVNLPLHELLTRLDDVPDTRLWVHCGSGYRASVAASLLQRAGKDVVHVDAMFADVHAAGVPTTAAS
jgi:rhodanese-related sulfurtransferase